MKLRLLVIAAAGLMFLAADAPDEAAKKDAQKLQGTWKVIGVVTAEGKKLTADEVPDVKLIFDGDKITHVQGGNAGAKFTYKLDPSKKPATYELTGENGQVIKGIYLIEGDDLKYAAEGDGKNPPKDFDAKGIVITTLKRDKKK
jgi:uncharacterized protein (TIGR03067 family)